MSDAKCPFVHLPSPPGVSVRCPYCGEISPPAEGVTITLDGIDWKARAQAAEQALSELKGEVLEKVGPFAEAVQSLGDETSDSSNLWESPSAMSLFAGDLRALSSLHEKLSSIGGSSSTETAASLADGKLTAGEARRKSDYEALGRACERHGLGWFADDGEMLFQAPDDVIAEQATAPLYEQISRLKAERDDAIKALSRMCGDA